MLAGASSLVVNPRDGLAGCALVTVAIHGASLVAMLAIAVAAARQPAAPAVVARIGE
jgi:hypothetical protein